MAKLSELKSLLAEARKRAPQPAHGTDQRAYRPSAAKEPARPDVDLSKAFADVQPLAPPNRVAHKRAAAMPTPAQRLADEAEALAASKYGAKSSPADWDIGQEPDAEQTFVRKGLGGELLSRLRRGHWSVQGELDLHRLNRDEARDALADFILEARGNGWRCVRVIHGKGLTSPNREPVLKNKVRRWLTQRDEVLAYCEAPRHAGGSGAVLVLLKSPGTALR